MDYLADIDRGTGRTNAEPGRLLGDRVMSHIIAARFTTFDAADMAKRALLESGFVDEDVDEVFVNPGGQHARFPVGGDEYADRQARPAGAGAMGGIAGGAILGLVLAAAVTFFFFHSLLVLIVATAVGAYIGSLGGAMFMTRGGGGTSGRAVADTVLRERESGVLLAVHVDDQVQSDAIDILRRSKGVDIEHASGRWTDGHWSDFDPTRPVCPVKDSDIC
jgi:hypothetical protein